MLKPLFNETELEAAYALHEKLLAEQSPQLIFSADPGAELLRVACLLSSFDGSSRYLNLATSLRRTFKVESSQRIVTQNAWGLWADGKFLCGPAEGATEILRTLLGADEQSTSSSKEMPSSDAFFTERSQVREALGDLERLILPERCEVLLGESFTFGRSYLTLLAAFPALAKDLELWGWYSPQRKVEVGVPEALVTDDVIAEPQTVMAGVAGLSEGRSPLVLAVGTSGWANSEETDQFSVALKAGENVRALRVEVMVSKNHFRSLGKRWLTQDLGVLSVMVLLLEHFGIYHSAARMVLEEYTAFVETVE